MTTNNHTASNDVVETTDLDALLTKWAKDELEGGELKKIDTSKVNVRQLGVLYHGDKDWFEETSAIEEVFENSEERQAKWVFRDTVRYPSRAVWSVIKGFKSNLLPPVNLSLEYPVGDEKGHLQVRMSSMGGQQVEVERNLEQELIEAVYVSPFSATRVRADIRLCRLDNVTFSTDVQFEGVIKITGTSGSKRHSKLGKDVEMSASIHQVLGSLPNFHTVDLRRSSFISKDLQDDSKAVNFTVAGKCSGLVAMRASLVFIDVQSRV